MAAYHHCVRCSSSAQAKAKAMATTTERDADLRVPSIALQDRDESARTKEQAGRSGGGLASKASRLRGQN